MPSPLRVALIGFGLAGRAFHAPFIRTRSRLRLTHVVQRRGRDAGQVLPGVELATDIEQVLVPGAAVDLVVIATPNETHVPFARRALEAGKHVVVDKPMATTSAEGRALADYARSAGRLLAPYHNRRWDGDFLTVRELLGRGWLGELGVFESRFDRYRPAVRMDAWREHPGPGAGLLFDLGPHLLDQALELFGRPLALNATVETERAGAQVDDHFEIALDYGSFEVRLGAGMMARSPGPRFQISGTGGSYVKYGTDPQEDALRAGRLPDTEDWGREPPDCRGTLSATIDGLHVDGRLETRAGNYGRFYDNVCDAIDGVAPLAVDADRGVEVIRLIELAFESGRAGGAARPC